MYYNDDMENQMYQSNQQTPEQQHTPQNQTPPSQMNTPLPAQQQIPKTSSSVVVDKVEQLSIFMYFFVASVLLFRFILSLFGAKQSSPFVDFVYQLTEPFMIPFNGMFGRTPAVGSFRLEFEVLVALAVYALIFFGISKLVGIIFK